MLENKKEHLLSDRDFRKNEFELDLVVITKDNIALYYEFMSDEQLRNHIHLIDMLFSEERIIKICLEVDSQGKNAKAETFKGEMRTYITGYSYFGIKDTLKPIDEYIEEIKGSSEYKEYIYDKLNLNDWNKIRDFIYLYQNIHLNMMEHIETLRVIAKNIVNKAK